LLTTITTVTSSDDNAASAKGDISTVRRGQMLEAVEDILRSANLTLKSDTKTLMTENALMREESVRREKHVQKVRDRVKDLAVELVKINEAFYCPITREVMEDPVVCMDGHTYERYAIVQWLETHDTSPKTNARLPSRFIVSNHALRAEIEASKSASTHMTQFLESL
jgi:hypothetical protein